MLFKHKKHFGFQILWCFLVPLDAKHDAELTGPSSFAVGLSTFFSVIIILFQVFFLNFLKKCSFKSLATRKIFLGFCCYCVSWCHDCGKRMQTILRIESKVLLQLRTNELHSHFLCPRSILSRSKLNGVEVCINSDSAES